MSIKTLGESINIGANNTISKNINLSTGSNITFASGTSFDIKGNAYFPHSSNVNIGDNTTTLQSILNSGIPTGGIMIWSGLLADVPSGWAVCDGTLGRPNLQNLFVIGTDVVRTVHSGNTSNQVTITTANLPQHVHTGTTTEGGVEHTHTYIHAGSYYQGSDQTTGVYASGRTSDGKTVTTNLNNHNHTISTVSTGLGQPIVIIPPYYALFYIMKL
jgi:hypothetical protein